jgi:hypothetical protein
MALSFIQPVREKSTRDDIVGKERSARRTGNLNAIYEPIV